MTPLLIPCLAAMHVVVLPPSHAIPFPWCRLNETRVLLDYFPLYSFAVIVWTLFNLNTSYALEVTHQAANFHGCSQSPRFVLRA